MITIDDVSHGPREAREDEPGDHGHADQADKRFQGNHKVRRAALRADVPVTDGRRSLNAEEKRVAQTAPPS